ncbi:hypothetical protein [Desulfobacter curvatus]|uniref:hypothetical protein n=1 Tax=Desulfobacter curvatus TaxID=2290 RepID=UPI000375CDE5|nr:hypothetical protein [Desulfobacter curvatus]
MIEATETQVQSDIFDFLRIIDNNILRLKGTEEIGLGANFSLRGIHQLDQLDSVIQSETEIKEKA